MTIRNILPGLQIEKEILWKIQLEKNEKKLYRVFNETAMEDLLETDDLREARDVAYNHQCVLLDNINNKVIHDYFCY